MRNGEEDGKRSRGQRWLDVGILEIGIHENSQVLVVFLQEAPNAQQHSVGSKSNVNRSGPKDLINWNGPKTCGVDARWLSAPIYVFNRIIRGILVRQWVSA